MKLVLKILALVLCPIVFGQVPDPVDQVLTEQWINGYLYFFREHLEDVRIKTPMDVTYAESSGGGRNEKSITIKNLSTVESIVNTIQDDVTSSVRRNHIVTESGSHFVKEAADMLSKSIVSLSWRLESQTFVISIRKDDISSFFYREGFGKKHYIMNPLLECSPELAIKVTKIIQQDSRGNVD